MMKDLIRRSLEEGLSPTVLDIVDESGQHAGHAGARPEGETHFRVLIVSEQFEGVSRVARQQAVYALLDAAFERGLHALAMRTMTPSEHEDIL